MVDLKEVGRENFEEFIELNGIGDQSEYIDSNVFSLAEAYKLINCEEQKSLIYAIYLGDKMVGFILLLYKPPEDDEDIDNINSYYISRIMIEKKYRGYGLKNQAIEKLTEELEQRRKTKTI